MTTTETKIVDKFLTEIEAAEPSVRAAMINDYYSFLGVIEKRITLSKVETEAKSLAATVEGEVAAVGTELKNLV